MLGTGIHTLPTTQLLSPFPPFVFLLASFLQPFFLSTFFLSINMHAILAAIVSLTAVATASPLLQGRAGTTANGTTVYSINYDKYVVLHLFIFMSLACLLTYHPPPPKKKVVLLPDVRRDV